jgi:pimeloyl-ACP methyl ester carboxylesterase
MTLPAVVLIHGGAHTATCWDLTIAQLKAREPEMKILAVNLPGRGADAAALATVTSADFVDSIVGAVRDRGFDEVILVGHSMAGLILPGVAERLGAAYVREMIYVAAFVPRQGSTIADSLRGPFAPLVKWIAWRGHPLHIPALAAWFAFYNGMTVRQRKESLSHMCVEAPRVFIEKADRSGMPPNVPITWIMTLRDRAVSPRQQMACIESLGGVSKLLMIDTCHNVMLSEPSQLATLLIERFRA